MSAAGDPTRDEIERALRDVKDPETGIDVVELGLVYAIAFDAEAAHADVTMTLTTGACPAGPALVEGVRRRVERVPGVASASVRLTFDPPWTPERIRPAGRAQLGW